MAKQLTLSLNKKLIIEAVKADTYITGEVDKSADAVKNSALAYNEQAGDDLYHERKLFRTLAGAVGSLEANLAEFVDTSAPDAIKDTLSTADDNGAFTITIMVSERYNNGLAYPIAQLSQEYIVNKMLYYLWQSIRPALAKDYLSFSAESFSNIRLCLAKTAPTTNDASYEDVGGQVLGGSGVGSITTIDFAELENGVFKLKYSDISSAFSNYGNAILTCSNPSVSMDVMIDNTKVFTIGYTPYNLTSSDMMKLMKNIGSNTHVTFDPTNNNEATTILTLTARTSS